MPDRSVTDRDAPASPLGTPQAAGPFHTVLVGRSGGHPGTNIYVVGPGPKRHALTTSEAQYRREQRLASSVSLVAKVVFSGGEAESIAFVDRLTAAIDAQT